VWQSRIRRISCCDGPLQAEVEDLARDDADERVAKVAGSFPKRPEERELGTDPRSGLLIGEDSSLAGQADVAVAIVASYATVASPGSAS
jgi:hypothetical protein